MKKLYLTIILLPIVLLTGCARDLSDNVYTSDSTLSLTLEGQIIAVRAIKIKETDKLGDNTTGIIAGGAGGAALGSNNGSPAAIVGGAIAGGLVGAVVEDRLSQSKGWEYIVKVDP